MKPTVLLLHGLARTDRSLHMIKRDLHRAGYGTWSKSYPSRKASIEVLATEIAEHVERDLPESPLVAVTHSMGGIVARHLAERLNLQRIVMLAPPNQGSVAARALKDSPLFHRIYGPALRNIQEPSHWPIPSCPIAVIAGTKGPSFGAPHSWLLKAMGVFNATGPNDGVVTVQETRLARMAGFATVCASHTWIMNHPETRQMVSRFITEGRLDSA